MSRGINKAIIVGNLGADPDVKYTANGSAVARITVATSEEWKDKQTGEKQSRTEWHRVVAFGRLAEIMGEYLRKGSQVYIEGSLRTSSYEKEGQKHYSTDIVANELQMLGSRGGENRSQSTPRSGSGNSNDATPPDDFNDEIPFITRDGIY